MEKGHQTWWPEPFLCGNPFPATLASSLQDEAAAFRLHARAVAVRRLAPMVVRLIRLLQFVHLPEICTVSAHLERLRAWLAIPHYTAQKRSVSSVFPQKTVHNRLVPVEKSCGKGVRIPDCLLITLPAFDKIGKDYPQMCCFFHKFRPPPHFLPSLTEPRRREHSAASCALFFCGGARLSTDCG